MPIKPAPDAATPPTPGDPPATVAVALGGSGPGGPVVVASGRGWVAEQILDLAFAHGIKVRADADLVEILATLDVQSVIPAEAVVAVAEILSRIYRANAALAEASSS